MNFPGLNARNDVPKWQRLHQTHDGLRQWEKVRRRKTAENESDPQTDTFLHQGPRAKAMLYPYYALLIFTTTGTCGSDEDTCHPY